MYEDDQWSQITMVSSHEKTRKLEKSQMVYKS